MTGVCILGAYQPGYPRHDVIARGLKAIGIPVQFCGTNPRRKVMRRYPALVAAFIRAMRSGEPFDVVLVPEFRHKDVPLASILASVSGRLCVFDPLVSRYDTRVGDRGDANESTFQAWHNRNLDRWSMSLPDLLLADTHAHGEYFRRHFASADTPVRVLPVGYDDTIFEASDPIERGDGVTRVLFYGNYLPLHGVRTIVEAADRIRHHDDIRFELIGGGQTYAEVERLVRDRNLTNVVLRPRMPIEEIATNVRDADICLGVFGTSEKAGRVVPNKVYQCMGAGRPVITADSSAIGESFEDGRDVVCVPPGDAVSLASKIEWLASDAEARRRIGRAAGELAAGQFSARRIGERFASLCDEALRRKGGA